MLLGLRARPFGQPPNRAHCFSCSREYFFARALPPRRPASATVIGLFLLLTLSVYLTLCIFQGKSVPGVVEIQSRPDDAGRYLMCHLNGDLGLHQRVLPI